MVWLLLYALAVLAAYSFQVGTIRAWRRSECPHLYADDGIGSWMPFILVGSLVGPGAILATAINFPRRFWRFGVR